MKINQEAILPTGYNETKIVLLPRDPAWMFAYWEISQSAQFSFSSRYGNDIAALILRVYDVTNIIFDGSNANRYFDIRVNENLGNWYINAGEYNKVWCVEIGYLLKDGRFIMIARSNCVALPKCGVSNVEDAAWASLHIFEEKLFEQIGDTSANMIKFSRTEWGNYFDFSKLPSSKFFNLPTSSSFPPALRDKEIHNTQKQREIKDKFFWLKTDMEIIVYGTTVPGAALTIQGKEVQVDKDGSFCVKFYLPDGKHDYNIKAISSDKSMSKRTFFTITKEMK
jgi:hypothetical protein